MSDQDKPLAIAKTIKALHDAERIDDLDAEDIIRVFAQRLVGAEEEVELEAQNILSTFDKRFVEAEKLIDNVLARLERQ